MGGYIFIEKEANKAVIEKIPPLATIFFPHFPAG